MPLTMKQLKQRYPSVKLVTEPQAYKPHERAAAVERRKLVALRVDELAAEHAARPEPTLGDLLQAVEHFLAAHHHGEPTRVRATGGAMRAKAEAARAYLDEAAAVDSFREELAELDRRLALNRCRFVAGQTSAAAGTTVGAGETQAAALADAARRLGRP